MKTAVRGSDGVQNQRWIPSIGKEEPAVGLTQYIISKY
jgi:hypothetical protein